jgi:ABC-type sugar transport system ATPase subunit
LQDKLQQLNCQINLDASASTLEVADQQMVEISPKYGWQAGGFRAICVR